MLNKDDSDTKKILLDKLGQDRLNSASWIQRKEIASWSAIVFYVGIYWALFNFIGKFDKTNLQTSVICITIVACTFISITFFAFIHSQYASIYVSAAHLRSLQIIIFKIINPNSKYNINFGVSDGLDYPIFIEQEIKTQMDSIQQYRCKKHPIKILWYFYIGNWMGKKEKRKIHNREIIEASIYSMLIIFYILYIGYAYILLFY